MATLGFKYKDGGVVCYDCFMEDMEEEDESKIMGVISEFEVKNANHIYFCVNCGFRILETS